MYQELVNALKEHHCDKTEKDSHEFCEECYYYVFLGKKAVCVYELMHKAADAIEDLEKSINTTLTEFTKANNKRLIAEAKLRESEVDNINLTGWLAEEYAKHLWIPVTERLPKYNEIVLISNGKSVGDGFLEHRHNIIGEEYDRWFTHFSDIEEEEVNWWMPLPKPPKEDIKW